MPSAIDRFLDFILGNQYTIDTDQTEQTLKIRKFVEHECLNRNSSPSCQTYATTLVHECEFMKAARIFQKNCMDNRNPESCDYYATLRSGAYKYTPDKKKPVHQFPELNPSVSMDFYLLGCEYGKDESCFNAALLFLNDVLPTKEAGIFTEYSTTPYQDKCPFLVEKEDGTFIRECTPYFYNEEKIKKLKIQNVHRAMTLLEKSCAHGTYSACALLSNMFGSGLHSLSKKPDLDKKYDYLKKACFAGDFDSCYSAYDMLQADKVKDPNVEMCETLMLRADEILKNHGVS